MIHVRGESPIRLPPPAPIVREHIPESIALKFYMRALAKLDFDFRSHCIFVEGRRRLIRQRLNHREHFFLAHLCLTTRHLEPGQRHEFALVQHDGFRPAQEPPPLPGATGDDQENQPEKGRRHERIDPPDERLARVVDIRRSGRDDFVRHFQETKPRIGRKNLSGIRPKTLPRS